MPLQSATIFFNDSSSQYNKELVEFLERNLTLAIKKGGLCFIFKICKKTDLSALRALNINKLPALVIKESNYIGVPEIIDEINYRIKSNIKKIPKKSEEELTRDYTMSTILENVHKNSDGKLVVSEAMEFDDKNSALAKYNAELDKRATSIGHTEDSLKKNREMQGIKPSRSSTDDRYSADDEFNAEFNAEFNTEYNKINHRADNVQNNSMAQYSNNDNSQDDMMMEALLNKIID